jgi:hypothetical protein
MDSGQIDIQSQRGENTKKVLTMAIPVLISDVFVTVTFAQTPEKTETTTTTTKTKSGHMEFTGKVMNMDTEKDGKMVASSVTVKATRTTKKTTTTKETTEETTTPASQAK